ncbi:sensor histidine kinase [Algoriphagus yeomjeoni]|uniref:sensor histidine kinase n=1 Tax=Algoriphagus yeomjeoni TaxID=291403 RepID=UPI003CE4E257
MKITEALKEEIKRLQEAVDQRTSELLVKNRELEIEASLEKVRSRSLAMQKSEELAEASLLLEAEIRKLGIENWGCAFHIYDEETSSGTPWDLEWFTSSAGILPFYNTPRENVFLKYYEESKKGKPLYIQEFGPEVINEHYDYLKTLPILGDALTELHNSGVPLPERQIDHVAFFNHGHLLFITYKPVPEAHTIFIRFAKAFNQAYTRFLDLQKAEAQAREGQIQLALERVRARTMAMQHSDELMETSELMFEQIKNLGIKLWSCGFSLWHDDDSYFLGYNPGPHGKLGNPLKIPLTEDTFFKTIREAKRRNDKFLVFESEGESLVQTYNYMDGLPVVGETMRGFVKAGFPLPTFQVNHCGFFANGHLMFITEERNPEAIEIFKRFTDVFNQTYTRFLDLQKAEAQAREAKIEAALERIRSKSLAMHHSSELSTVVDTLLQEFTKLEFTLTFCIINLIDGDDLSNTVWAANPETGKDAESYYMKFEDYDFHRAMWSAWKSQDKRFVYTLEGEEKKIYDEYLYSETEFRRFPKHVQEANKALHRYVAGFTFFKYSGLQTVSENEITEADLEILERFGKVFEQSYTRFLDLQKAEAQAKEAHIESSLERVRAQTMAMHNSEDVGKCIVMMFEELTALGVNEKTRFGIGILNHENENNQLWTASKIEDEFKLHIGNLEMSWHPLLKSARKAWKEQLSLHTYILEGEDLINYYQMLNQAPDYKIQIPIDKLPDREFHYGFVFEHGFFYAFSPLEFSTDLIQIIHRFRSLFSQTYRRYLDLKKAEAQAREAQINLAVERVRARALAMFKSEEILEVVVKLKEEIIGLDIPGVAAAAILLKEKNGMFRSWDLTSLELNGESMHTPLDVPFEMEKTHPDFYLRKVWEKGTNYTVVVQDTKSLQITCDWLRENNKVKEAEEAEEFLKSSGLQRGYHPTVPLNNGRMILDLLDPPEDEIEFILTKMGGAFDLAYKRFEDLEKAEAQTREARIEAALEKIRARTMGMQHSDELPEAAHLLFTEVRNLGIPAWSCGYNVLAEDNKSSTCWMSSENEIQVPFTLPLTEHESLLPWYEAVKNGDELFVYDQGGEDLVQHYRYMTDLPELKPVFAQFEAAGISLPTYQVNHLAKFNQGFLLFITYEKVPEAHEVFKRFAKVFNQTYTRFLDLQKAETQAKEAQIELSLERIRAQVTAMRESEDLLEIVVNMRKEFVNLGHEAHYFWHMRWLPETYDKAMTSGDGTQIGMVMSLPRHIHGDIPAVAAWEKGNEPTHILAMDVDLAVNYVDKMVKLGDFERIDPQAPTLDDIRHIGGLTFVMARTTHGEIGFSLPGKVDHPPKESIDTLTRFAGVFDLAYRRFEDLLTAEKQNRKAKIELALERVRARAMAMQEPEELIQVANVMREEMGNLGVEELETSSIYINDSDTGLAECWYSILDVREGAKKNIADHFSLDYRDTWVGRQMFDFYQGDETNISILMKGEHRKEWINYCARQSPKLNGYYGIEIPERTYHLTKFSNGAIGAATPGEISHESWDLLQRAATVFSLAYSRFKDLSQAREDLKKLKQAKAKAEKALKELKSAQEQLVQQEKLASLGQLTAGIAHEIKNPLNFVNNFSDLSRELIEEVFEELENLEDSSTKAEILAILGDVKNNLFKVHEHGTRANGIVSSMLQHSRASGNKREPKSFNPLVKEFTNLSFHGMRAAKEPINVDIELKLDPKVGEVSLISEDFSRVILNLCNNAFDAMRDKLKRQNGSQDAEAEVYLPKLTVTTALQKDKVILSIADNGLGIPKEIQDKILQPFFTTKKGTEGTGLGLSITNDIIKAHGGQLDIQSQPGSTIFKIQLTL